MKAPEKLSLRIYADMIGSPWAFYRSKEYEATDPTKVPKLTVQHAADLILKDFKGSGDQLSVRYNVLDGGPAHLDPFPNGFTIEIYSSDDDVLDAADVLLMTEPVPAANADAGLDQNYSFPLSFSQPVGDEQFLIAKLDSGATDDEGSEDDNQLEFQEGVFYFGGSGNLRVHAHGTDTGDVITINTTSVVIDPAGEGSVTYPLPTSPHRVTVHGHGGNDTITPDAAVDAAFTLYGEEGDDTLMGGPKSDSLYGGEGNDTLRGLAGGDSYYFSGEDPGADMISEAANDGTDILDFQGVSFRVDVDLEGAADLEDEPIVRQFGLHYENETDRDIEWVFGTPYDDAIHGNDLDNFLIGGDGMDTLEGRGGDDTLWGSGGGDIYQYRGSVADNLGSDTITESFTDDGTDFLHFSGFVANDGSGNAVGITTDLDLTQIVSEPNVLVAYGSGSDKAIEGIVGTALDDILYGNALDNHLDGAGGVDELYGRFGEDELMGNSGSQLYGGAGIDMPGTVDDNPTEEPQFEIAQGSWTIVSGGFNGSQRTAPNTAAARAKWKFDDLASFGSWPDAKVFVTWDPDTSYASNARFEFFDSQDASLGIPAVTVNLQSGPTADMVDAAGRNWQSLGTFTDLGTGIRVALTNTDETGAVVADGPIVADAVMVVGPEAPMSPPMFSFDEGRLHWMHPGDMMMGLTGFEIQRSKTGLGDWQPWADETDLGPTAMATNPETHPVSAANTWFYQIRALSATRGPSVWTQTEVIDQFEERIVKISADVSTDPQPEITLKWLVQENQLFEGGEYNVFRKDVGTSQWNPVADVLMSSQLGGMIIWSDTDVQTGVAYEYRVERDRGDNKLDQVGYLVAGIDMPLVDQRGTLLLVVDERITTPLAAEIATLKEDLIGDGWKVEQIDANWDPAGTGTEDSGQAVSAVKQAIKAAYDADPQNVKAVFILGNVPVPYSGKQHPDGHPEHPRALPADTYYGDVDTAFYEDENDPTDFPISLGWTDELDLITTDTTGLNVGSVTNRPGDGRFDNGAPDQQDFVVADVPDSDSEPHDNVIERDVELIVGRVDLSNMSSFANDFDPPFVLPGDEFDLEVALLKRYLDRDHEYRHGTVDVPQRGFVVQGNKGQGQLIRQWQNYTAVVGHDSVSQVNWLMHMDPEDDPEFAALFASASSTAPHARSINIRDGIVGVDDDDTNGDESPDKDVRTFVGDVADRSTLTAFHAVSGSYLVDWNWRNNLMRGFMANDGYGLTAQWSKDGLWWLHMGLGETVGFANQVAQGDVDGTEMVPTYQDLLGDPSLRMHVVKPPSNVNVTDNGDGTVTVSWDASPDDVWEYRVYRKAQTGSDFTHVGTTPSSPSSNITGTTDDNYMVRAIKREVTPSGTYFNASQGVFSAPVP